MIKPIDHVIKIDLTNVINMNKSIIIKKNDNKSHNLKINIFNNSVQYDLTGSMARIYLKKSDKTEVFQDCILDDALSGKISCLLTTQALSYAGLVEAEVTIYGTDGEILTSITFEFVVSMVLRDDVAIESTSEFTALTNALNVVYTKLENGEFVGVQGIPGPIGATGATGEQGIQGIKGIDGTGTLVEDSSTNGNIMINGTETKVYDDTQVMSDLADMTQDYTTTLYVSTTGNDSNDGLTVGTPFATLQKAFNVLSENSHRMNKGTWKIQLAAGTYNEQASLSSGLKSKNRIQIIGAVDGLNVPTVIFDGGSGLKNYGMQFSDYAFVSVKDVKFQNFTGYSQQGLLCQHFCNLYLINVHALNCGFAGVNANVLCRLYMQGGVIDGCRIGIRAYAGSVVTVGYNSYGVIENGTIIINCTEAGVKLYNQCSGHVDYSTIEGNNVGIQSLNQSRVHALGNDIKNNTVGVRASICSTWFNDDNIFTTNTTDFENYSFSMEFSDELKKSTVISKISVDTIPLTGKLVETNLINNYTILANTFIKKGQKYRIKACGTLLGAGTKTIYIRFGGGLIGGFTSLSDSIKSWAIDTEVWAIDSTNQKVFSKWTEGNVSYSALYTNKGILMSNNQAVTLSGVLSNVAGTLTVEAFEIEQLL